MFLVLGNATVDESMAVEAWPSPGQTVVVGPPRRDLGGKGANQALVLGRTGAPVRFVAAIGRDAEGDWIAARLAAEGLPESDLLRVEAATDRSMIFVNGAGENAIASTTAAASSIEPAMAAACVARLGPGDGLLMQGNLTLAATRAAFAAARRTGVRTVFNPSPVQPGFADLFALVDLLVLNEGEAAAFGGAGAPEEAAQALRRAGAGTVVLTLGGRGAVLADDAGADHVPARPVPVVDTTGAGDTFMGVLAAAVLHRGLPLRAAVAAAGAAAALTVQRQGTVSAFPSGEEIAGLLPG